MGWVGMGWLCGGDIFILSVRLSILAFSSWRWFEGKMEPIRKYHLYFLEFFGWVGLGWVGLAGVTCLFFRYVCPFLHSQTGDGLRKKREPIRKYHLYFLEFLVGLGWVGLGWLCGGDMFILSLRLSILAFSNWRWFEDNCRPSEENIIFYFLGHL